MSTQISNILYSFLSLNASCKLFSTLLTISPYFPKFFVYQSLYYSPLLILSSHSDLKASNMLKNSIDKTSISSKFLNTETLTCDPLVIFKNIPFKKNKNVSISKY
jgi:hypothetical protein